MEVNQRVALLAKVEPKSSNDCKNYMHTKSTCHWHWIFILPVMVVVLILSTIIFITYSYMMSNYYEDRSLSIDLLDVRKCPACAGQSFCPSFFRNELQFIGKYPGSLDSIDGYLAAEGIYPPKKRVRLRRLASPAESQAVDAAVCRRGIRQGASNLPKEVHDKLPCIPHLAIMRWRPTHDADDHDGHPYSVDAELTSTLFFTSGNNQATSNHNSTLYSPATRCVSDRLFQHLQNRFLERTSFGAETRWLRFDQLMFLFNLAIDPQSIITQAFPRSQNWPFVNYLGSCGRWTVEDYHGMPLTHFCMAPLWLRLQILRNIFSLPGQLEHPPQSKQSNRIVDEYLISRNHISTTTTDGYTIYLGNFDLDSLFLVDPITYNVTIANLRHAIIVDTELLQDFEITTEHSVSESALSHLLHGLKEHNCFGNVLESGDAGGNHPPCVTAEHADQLCSHITSDHNYWAVCAALIYGAGQGSSVCHHLLDNLPTELIDLIKRCAHESGSKIRQQLFELIRASINVLIDRNPLPRIG